MNTHQQYLGYVGKTGVLNSEGLKIDVSVQDIKFSFGHTRFLIKPVAGEGEKWINASNISLKLDKEFAKKKK